MAEEAENKELLEKMSEAECKALYDLIVKKDLSDDEKAQIKNIVESNPQVLAQEEFTKNFKLTDLAFECQGTQNLPQLLEQNAKDIDLLKTALTNLKDCHVTHNGINKTAARYLLDTPTLQNGELIGTQIVKNIHFLSVAKKDESVKTLDENTLSSIDNVFNQNEAFYKSLYATDGYQANPNARNLSGQKVETLMHECINARKENAVEHLNDTIETVKDRAFMTHPEQKRETMNIEAPRQTMSFEALSEKAYRGTLTVEEKEQFEKMKKNKNKEEGNFSKVDLDPHRPQKQEHKDKFKEQDVIDYMYNEWFLAGLSWLFDKGEDLLDAALDKLIDNRNENRARRSKEASEAKDVRAKEVIAKVHSFEDGVKGRFDLAKTKRAERNTHFVEGINELKNYDFAHLNDTDKETLKNKYGEALIDKFITKASEPNGQKALSEFFEKCPQRYENMFKDADRIEKLAMLQAETEMINKVMKSTGSWCKLLSSKLKSDEDLLKEYDKLTAKRAAEISASVSAVRADARVLTEAKLSEALSQVDPKDERTKQKVTQEFIQENIFSYYNQKIASATNHEEKQKALKQKELFEKTYASLSPEKRTVYIIETVANNEATAFLDSQYKLEATARQIQVQDRESGRYEANGAFPNKTTAENLNKASNIRDSAQKSLIDDKFLSAERDADLKAEMGLYEATFKSNTEKVLESANNISSINEAKLSSRRDALEVRKKALNQVIQSLQLKKVMSGLSPVVLGKQGRE